MLARLTIAAALLAGLGALGVAASYPQAAKDSKAPAADRPDGRYEIDPVHTALLFKINHVGVSNFYGRFNKVSGKLLIDADDPAESLINFKIDTASIDTNNKDRDSHLRNADFFNAEEFPAITFESETVKAIDATHFEVTGKLDLHGVQKTITVKAEQTGFGAHAIMGTLVGYEARFTIKRSEFGMGDHLESLGDEVEVILSLEAARSK